MNGILEISGTKIFGITNPNRIAQRVPTVSITHDRVSPKQAAESLAMDEICVTAGHNYAYEVVKHLGIEEESGVLRIGLAHYNTEDEVERTLAALRKTLK